MRNMTPESSPTQHEAIGKTYTAPPAVESLVLPDPSQESWLEDISTNESFQEQVRERGDIITHIDTVFSHLPRADMSIEEALKENILSEEQVSNLYTSLSNLIGNDDYSIFHLNTFRTKIGIPNQTHLRNQLNSFVQYTCILGNLYCIPMM